MTVKEIKEKLKNPLLPDFAKKKLEAKLKAAEKKVSKPKPAPKKEPAYVTFINKDKGFKTDKKYFDSYEEAEKWAKKEFEKFDPDMISYGKKPSKTPMEKAMESATKMSKKKEMTVDDYMKKSKELNKIVDDLDAEIHKVIDGRVGEMGLVLDVVRSEPKYKSLNAKRAKAWKQLQDFNKSIPKKISQEMVSKRREERKKAQPKFIEELVKSGLDLKIADKLYYKGWKVTTGGEMKGDDTPYILGSRKEIIDGILESVQQGVFEAGFKYVDWEKDKDAIKFLSRHNFVDRGEIPVKEKDPFSTDKNKFTNHKYRIYTNKNSIIALRRGYSSLVSTDIMDGYKMWLEIISGGVEYLKGTSGFTNYYGGLDIPESLEILKGFTSSSSKKYKLGDKWSKDFDYDGMFFYSLDLKASDSVNKFNKLADSFEDVNYHRGAKMLRAMAETRETKEKVSLVTLARFKEYVKRQQGEEEKPENKVETKKVPKKEMSNQISECKKALEAANFSVKKKVVGGKTVTVRAKRSDRQIINTKTSHLFKTVTKDVSGGEKENPDIFSLIDQLEKKITKVVQSIDKAAKAKNIGQLKKINDLFKEL